MVIMSKKTQIVIGLLIILLLVFFFVEPPQKDADKTIESNSAITQKENGDSYLKIKLDYLAIKEMDLYAKGDIAVVFLEMIQNKKVKSVLLCPDSILCVLDKYSKSIRNVYDESKFGTLEGKLIDVLEEEYEDWPLASKFKIIEPSTEDCLKVFVRTSNNELYMLKIPSDQFNSDNNRKLVELYLTVLKDLDKGSLTTEEILGDA